MAVSYTHLYSYQIDTFIIPYFEQIHMIFFSSTNDKNYKISKKQGGLIMEKEIQEAKIESVSYTHLQMRIRVSGHLINTESYDM